MPLPTQIGITIERAELVNVIVRAKLTSDGEPLKYRQIQIYRSLDLVNWEQVATLLTNEYGEAGLLTEAVNGMYFKALFPGDDDFEACEAIARFTYVAPEPRILIDIGSLLTLILVVTILIAGLKAGLTYIYKMWENAQSRG
jgi:hypothetical protein